MTNKISMNAQRGKSYKTKADRLLNAQHLQDLVIRHCFGVLHTPNKLPIKVKDGVLIKHNYVGKKKDSTAFLSHDRTS